MFYYKCVREFTDYKTGWTAIENELITLKEIRTRFPHICVDNSKLLKPVNINKNKTFKSFGVRFETTH